MKIGEFIQKYMDKKSMTQAELSRRSGVPTSTLNSIINRNNDRIAIEMVLRICEVLECDIEEYVNSMRHDPPERVPALFAKKYNALDTYGKDLVNTVLEMEYERCIVLPKVENPEVLTWSICYNEYKASAGTGVMLDEYERLDRIDVIDTPEARRADYGLMISGDSMEPVYHDGDVVLVRQTNNIDVGEIGIFVVNGDGYIKKFGGDRLISLNSDYGDIPLHEYDSIRCCGLVIGVAELPE